MPTKPITQEYLKSVLNYNPINGAWTWIARAGLRVKPGKAAGSFNDRGYLTIRVAGQLYKASRLAFLYMTGRMPPDNYHMDHKDGIKGNNKWSNLRLATHSQNMVNRKYPSRTLPRGVYLTENGRYQAKVANDHIGMYDSLTEAAEARTKAAIERYGEEWLLHL